MSVLNDISSEMLYPMMPLFLQSIGFSTVLIGALEGFAEAIPGLSNGYFGRLSDATAKRLPFFLREPKGIIPVKKHFAQVNTSVQLLEGISAFV